MGLDSRYVIAPSLQEFFIDKDSGLPMSGGQVFFYEDNARNVPKPVYEISGNPPNYSYTVLPNPVTLSAVGTFQDASGNDIIPYYFPYDDQGNVDLYYIEVYDSDGVLQFTREGWPNFSNANVTADQDVTNFVPNGQFLLHNNIPADTGNSFVVNKVYQDVTIIGQGGWTFERSTGSSATDFVSFPEYGSITSPSGNPRYAVQITTTIAGTDTRKDLCLKFPGVNTFASNLLAYNYYFEAQSLTGSSFIAEIIIRKFFGTGGSPSPTTETVIGSVSITPTVTFFNTELLFGINTSKTLGTNNDDYVQIIVRLPPTGVQSALFTDFAMTINSETLTAFPTQTESQQLYASTAGWLPMPDPNGFDLYLPAILTLAGMTFDHSQVGEIVQNMDAVTNSIHPTTNLLRCDGASYLTKDYSPLGIPYARLGRYLLANGDGTTNNVPIFGTGTPYSTAYVSAGNTSQIMLSTNQAGSQTTAADGAAPTGFTFGPQVIPGNPSRQFLAGANNANIVTAYNTQHASPMAFDANAGTSGFTVTDQVSPSIGGYTFAFNIITVAAAALNVGAPATPALYFSFGDTGTHYYVWFQVGANGADPAPFGGASVKVVLSTTMTAQDVAVAVVAAMQAAQVDLITVGALPPASSFFTFNANSLKYVVWYKVNAVGTQPVVASTAQYIEVDVLSTDTTAQVATKTQIAINSLYFAVPDLQGVFLRGIDNLASPKWDFDVSGRFSNDANIPANNPGTFELGQYTKHAHPITVTGGGATDSTVGTGGGGAHAAASTGTSGQDETRPVNAYVNFSIRY